MPIDSIKANPRQLARIKRDLGDAANQLPRVISASVRRTTDTVRSRLVRAVAANIAIAQNKLYQRASRGRPIQQRFSGRPTTEGHISAGGEPDETAGTPSPKTRVGRIPIGPSRFGARQTTRGVSYRIGKAEPRQTIENAFLLTFRSGHTAAFARMSRRRGAIAKLHGPSVPHVALEDSAAKTLVSVDAGKLFERVLSQQLDRALERRR